MSVSSNPILNVVFKALCLTGHLRFGIQDRYTGVDALFPLNSLEIALLLGMQAGCVGHFGA